MVFEGDPRPTHWETPRFSATMFAHIVRGKIYARPARPIDPSRQNVPKKIQRFFTDHTDEVLCLDAHPSGSLVASGQRGRLPKVSSAARCFESIRVCRVSMLHMIVFAVYQHHPSRD